MRRLALLFALPSLALAVACHRQAAEVSQPTPDAARREAPQPAPPMQAVTTSKGKPMPRAAFDDLATKASTTLAAFKGRPVLVNLWATWCGPCVRELPALDAIAKQQGGKLQVVAISEDLQGAEVVTPFLAEHNIATLHPYHDPSNALLTELHEASLPVSILYGADGKELWRVAGDLDWSGAKAKALLGEAGV